jgi:serine/threonine protein phosphatase 1
MNAFDMRPLPQRVPATPPAGTRLYVVGDIHGYLDTLTRLHRLIARDAAEARAERNVVVYLGDYVDRGPDSRGVVEILLRAPLTGFERVHLKGNHEAALLDFLDGREPSMDWLRFGGIETLASYGVPPPRRSAELDDTRIDFERLMPPDHLAFYRDLALTRIEGDFLMVHAGIRPGIAIADQSPDDLMWIREPFLRSDASFGKIVVHGHTIEKRPQIRHNRIGIDTGIYRYGKLTCAVMESGELGFIQA